MNNPAFCVTCGQLIPRPISERCNNCWEVETRLEDYLKSPGGQKHIRSKLPLLDDWVGGKPDAWDYEAVLTENKVEVLWEACIDDKGKQTSDDWSGWSLTWKHGVIYIGNTTEAIARRAAALFVSLWLRGISASFADKLMMGNVTFQEYQEGIISHVSAAVRRRHFCGPTWLQFDFGRYEAEDQFLRAAGYQEGDQVSITFQKIPGG